MRSRSFRQRSNGGEITSVVPILALLAPCCPLSLAAFPALSRLKPVLPKALKLSVSFALSTAPRFI